MKGYKAFKKGLICRDKQYAENTVFEKDEAIICDRGMHFCINPLDTLEYYPLIDDEGNMTEFAEVEALETPVTDDNKKYCTKKLRVGAKMDLSEFIKARFSVTYENIKKEAENSVKDVKLGGDDAILAGGDYSRLVGGDYSRLVGGDGTTLAGGDDSILVGSRNAILAGGNFSILAGGFGAKLIGGDGTTLAGGIRAQLVGGDYSILLGGDDAILAGGSYSTLAGGDGAKLIGGDYSILAGDNANIAKGKKGTVILLVERDSDYNIVHFKAEQVDGKKIKEDTFYKLENGEFVEVK